MITGKKQLEIGRDILLYGLSFLLLLEWLLPLPHITDTGFIHIFVLLTAVFFFVTFLQLPVVISLLIKTISIGYGVYLVFFGGPFFSLEWVSYFLMDVRENVNVMINGEWYALSDMFRSFLFLILLAIMSYLLFYWTVHARRILFFLIFTVIYVAIIDTFTVYDATIAIIRTFVIGFLLLGLVTIYRMIETEKVASAPKFLPARLAMLLVVMIVTGGIFGFLSPKLDPQWDDPVPFVRAAVGIDGAEGGEGPQRIGYGDNDEELGGGFVDDNTPVFYAAATRSHYWRGETKDFYTGRGWETTTPPLESTSPFDGELDANTVEIEELEAEVAIAEEANRGYNHLFYPGELITRSSIMDVTLFLDAYTEKARTFIGNNPVELSHYRYEYGFPTYHIEGLRSSSENDPTDIFDYYTQLPNDLPDRVGELAEELVAEEDNRYDRAKAIENYLSGPTFRYETEDVAVPGEGEDYVDQFLFETLRGYCDNFSTSMVVLLRSLDIPARWVKGFTQGEQINSLEDGRDVYQVTNGNAHSWVEVYFPEVGWVPFEPTSGFTSAYEFIEPDEDPNDHVETEEEQAEEDVDVEDVFANSEDEEEQLETGMASGSWTIRGGSWLLGILFVGSVLFLLFKNKKVVTFYTLQRFRRKQDEKTFIPAYERLLWLLEYVGYRRMDGETLREYAERIDQHFESKEMRLLTAEYERVMYGGKPQDNSWTVQKPNWEAFTRKIQS
ncbi:transglutaminase TgpA family protein [Halalkalibacter nanhaiisediminis]|uniref:Uncharacterized protein DUF4129 n=1 Tax=Halalkalibacter nanhaiisediminis TaxID=688079 RepID=A0A562QBA9_9BACI|nr:transglutaminaseTgpA domain-containing protein [Halalkalibacter nanhaiisediminis]TWI53999.1 uncharacterized protein DUF4129 [Halalkalibacter nanhaiisediminis]